MRAPKPSWFPGVKCDQCGLKLKHRKALRVHVNSFQKVPVHYFCTFGCKSDWIEQRLEDG